MNSFTRSRFICGLAAALCLAAGAQPAAADDRGSNRDGRQHSRQDRRQDARQDNRQHARQGARYGAHQDYRQGTRRDGRGYVLDNRYNHNHYYPPRGRVYARVPRGAVVVRHGGSPYYYNHGIWYRPSGRRFVVVTPPIGLYVGALPSYYSTVWARGMPYYYADDVYYRPYPGRQGYIVSDPPDDSEVSDQEYSAPASGDDEIFIYPKNGQSEQQQGTDRFECHSWAANQTGFDPTQPQGGVDASQSDSKRVDYYRAMTACLEGRGYSVK